ncbi:type I phosphodiesterase/nucleotide pyrophosphatase (macronuclear) [Tetrahymena thermophila SB210]|uniref:Type I phosphodiesterase/nucleotide pyrophosphatase n=2 Tax=Tetrahymena thermophila (strain SB210) TaxID=312017 RepID=Q23F50_TETTS|nr:type I phosphodiesterase/nucleotide pyrophosphatase [Tetrahymena thermophila SB210]EAR95303.2 type I phosphodiesterase/nucleotide pyrophosphatase [Tetrahymena thermophila SB210]|eukprot:XP_001015548.2 type I phosphodiesterase/nucleotide pyrophosphatase [Tetrahymena thermophila SB210]
MNSNKKIFLLVLQFLALLISTMYVYQNGFFIIKETLPDISSTSEFIKPQANKVILVIIDALRFDFTQKFEENDDGTPLEHFKNKLTIIQEMMEKQPNNTIHLQGYSDPPTATTQRIKGITIGNLPSFIEIAATFTFSQREEDNLLLQMQRHNLEIVHLGDDVWTGLFSKQFTRDFYADSLDIFDFHTTDNVVIDHLEEELKQPNLKFLIAHFNGVDHVGHALNSNHEQMSKKLTQMDQQLRLIIKQMNDDDVLILMGDHGMSESGHHGGSTFEETSVGIFAYSKQGFKKEPRINNFDPTYKKLTNQIDIPSTISMLFGIPIPYNNIGLIINDFYPANTPLEQIFKDYHYNLNQVYKNIQKVQSLSKKMTDNQYLFIQTSLDDLEEEFKKINNQQNIELKEEMMISYINKVKKCQVQIKEICRKAWNQMNIPQILIGNINFILISLLCLVLAIYFMILSNHYDKSIYCQSRILTMSNILYFCFFLLSIVGISILFEITLGFTIGLLLIPTLVYYICYIGKDIAHITFLIKKKEESLILSFPVSIINRRLITFFLYFGFQAYSMNSLHAHRTEDMMIWYGLAIGTMIDCFFLFKDGQFKNIKMQLQLLSIPIILYLAQYFDVTQSIRYTQEQVRFELISKFMKFFTESHICIPSIMFFFYLNKKKAFQGISKSLFLANFLVVTIYFVILEQNENSTVNIMNVYVARISYLIMFVNAYLIFKNKSSYLPNKYILAHIINLNVTLLMLINKHSFYLCLIFHYVFDTYHSYSISQNRGSDLTTYAFLLALVQYFYLISGHKAEITSLQVQSAYVGFEKYNLLISGYLLTINQFSFQILGFFFSQHIQNTSFADQTQAIIDGQKKRLQQEYKYLPLNRHDSPFRKESQLIKQMSGYQCFMLYIIVMMTSTSINCTYNHDSLFLPTEFGPRFLFDLTQVFHAILHILIILVSINFF